jgi:hypothetical protein
MLRPIGLALRGPSPDALRVSASPKGRGYFAPVRAFSSSANTAKEIAEAEKKKAQETLGTKTVTGPENPANFSEEKTEGKPQRIN